ncbi:Zinc finger C2H2-type, partial [Trinorchestia longiramus]
RRRERAKTDSSIAVLPFDQLPDIGPISRKQPCPCPVCGVLFYQKSDFRHHYMVHSGEKPYACTQCDFRARQLTNLKRHMKEKHEHPRVAVV